jgi:Cys-tRNA(Pro)/Cys-tRNA(Cys) deacylase
MDPITTLILKGSLMNIYEQQLQAYLQEQHILAEHLSFDQPCHSVAEAARAVNASPEELVKNICLIDSDGQLITAIVKGEDRVSVSRIAKTLQRGASSGETSRNPGKNWLSVWRNSLIRVPGDVPD